MEEEWSQLSIRKHQIKQPTWLEQLRENNAAMGHNRNLSSNLATPHKTEILTPGSMLKSVSPNQTFDMSLQLEQTSDRRMTNRLTTQRKTLLPPMIKGSNLESLFSKKDSSLHELEEKTKELTQENEELKKLNLKLVEKMDYLQNIIDQEADGKEFYFNYPPKPDNELAQEVKLAQSSTQAKSKDRANKRAVLAQQIENAQVAKVKKFMENQLEKEKRLSEKKYNEMERSFTLEVDDLQEMLSKCCSQLGMMMKAYQASTAKFNSYYSECDKYIQDRETKLTQTRTDNSRLSQELELFQQLYNQEKNERQALQVTHETYIKEFEELNIEANRLRKEVIRYEEKYKFIDISKLHEKVQLTQTKLDASEGKCKALERDLFDLRDKILRATSQRFTGPKDIEEKPGEQSNQIWNADGEVEETAKALLDYIHNQVQRSFPQVTQSSRKGQPKQSKNFSPIKTALILDHYQNIEVKLQGKSSVTASEKKALTLSKVLDKNKNQQHQQHHHSQGLMQVVNQGHQEHSQIFKSPGAGLLESVYKSTVNRSKNHQQMGRKGYEAYQALGSVQENSYNQDLAMVNRHQNGISITDMSAPQRRLNQPNEKAYSSQPRPAEKKVNGDNYQTNRQTGTLQQKINIVSNKNISKKDLIRSYYQQNATLNSYNRQATSQEPIKHTYHLEGASTKAKASQDRHNSVNQKYQQHNQHDEELASFQIEIERRFVNAKTKTYTFPRVITLEIDQSDQSMYAEENGDGLVELLMNPQFQQESIIKSLLNKYQSLSSQKSSKERFCDKIKNNHYQHNAEKQKLQSQQQQKLQISQSSKYLQVKSVEKILSEQQMLANPSHQFHTVISQNKPVVDHNYSQSINYNTMSFNVIPQAKTKADIASQFFHHTHNRLQNSNKKLEFKNTSNLASVISPTAQQGLSLVMVANSSYLPQTTKNKKAKNDQENASYFVVGNINKPQDYQPKNSMPSIRSESQFQRLSSLEQDQTNSQQKQQQVQIQKKIISQTVLKKGKLDQILKIIGGGNSITNANNTSSQSQTQGQNFTQLNMFGGVDKKFLNYHQKLKGMPPQIDSITSSPKTYKRSNETSSKHQSPVNDQSTPRGQQRRIKMAGSPNAPSHSKSNTTLPKSISQSYKKFKQQEESQNRLSHRSSRTNPCHISSHGTPHGKGQESSRIRSQSQNSSRSRTLKQKDSQVLYSQHHQPSQHTLQPNIIHQNIKKIGSKSKTRRKLQHVASTLQITGTQALKKGYGEIYNSMVNLAKSPHGKEIPLLGANSVVQKYLGGHLQQSAV